MTSVSRKRLVFCKSKSCIHLINWISTLKGEISMNLAISFFYILIAIFVRSISLMMINLDFTSIYNISHAMSADLNINSVTIRDMIILKHITKCPIIFVWKKTALIKSLLLLKPLMNLNYTECKFMKDKIKKLILNNYVDFNIKDKVPMIKLLSLKTNKVLIWKVNFFHWKKVKIEYLVKLISNKINTSILETSIIVNLIKMNMLKKFFLKKQLQNKPRNKKVNQNRNKKVQLKIKRKSMYQNNKLISKKFRSLPFQYRTSSFYLRIFYSFNLSNGPSWLTINLMLNWEL